MKKLQVTGEFMLIDPLSRIEFNPGEPVEVEEISSFMADRIEAGQLAYVSSTASVAAPAIVEVVAEVSPVVEVEQPVVVKPAPVKRRKGRR